MPSEEPYPVPVPVPSPQCHRFMAQLNKRDLSSRTKPWCLPHIPAVEGEASALLSEMKLLPPESSNKQTQRYPLQPASAPRQCKLTAQTIQLLGSDPELLLHNFLQPACTSTGVLPQTLPNLLTSITSWTLNFSQLEHSQKHYPKFAWP